MKKTLLKLGLKVVVYLFNKLVSKWQSKIDGESDTVVETEYIQDVRINKDMAKMFNKYIKEHTVENTEE